MALIFPSISLLHFGAIERNGTLRLPSRQTKNNQCKISLPRLKIVSKVNELEVNNRRSAHYHPSIWGSKLIESLNSPYKSGIYKERAEKLEEEVKSMIDNNDDYYDGKPLQLLELIDDIERLGLGYRFKEYIRKALDKICSMDSYNGRGKESLHATALNFRLLRQHGYKISQDVFQRFREHDNGSFITILGEDVKGMLSLYEASYLAFEGENVLDEAKEFASLHLKNYLKNNMDDTSNAKQVSRAMELPMHRRIIPLEARTYIEAYKEIREDPNCLLLELAVQDFNMVQSIFQRDLQDMSMWWSGTGLANELSFARDRLMECFISTVGMFFRPHFSKFRKEMTKVASLVTVIDDIYDIYASLEELELFTCAVESWDDDALTNLPDYMKSCARVLYDIVNEKANYSSNEQQVVAMPYLRKTWADLCKSFLKEAKWRYTEYKPSLKEYLDNAWLSSSGALALVHAYFLVTPSPNITKEALKCLEKYDHLLRRPSMIFRLCNDLATSTAELERCETTNSISCYMNEFGVSEELARDRINKMIDETWKKMNKDQYEDSPFPKPFIEASINLARTVQYIYQHGDGHGAPNAKSKKTVMSLIIEPVSRL